MIAGYYRSRRQAGHHITLYV